MGRLTVALLSTTGGTAGTTTAGALSGDVSSSTARVAEGERKI